MARTISACIYCLEKPGKTRDHVPPKSFFPNPRPANSITVPSCSDCNGGAGKDEEFFLSSFMLSQAGISEAGKLLWKQRIGRSMDRNPGLRGKIAERLAPVFFQANWRIGQIVDEPRSERVINKIVRGLYFFEYGEPLKPSEQVLSLFLNSEERVEGVSNLADGLRRGTRSWPDVFTYDCGRIVGSPNESVWNLTLFNCIRFFAITGKKKSNGK